jgi:hypothetical protein
VTTVPDKSEKVDLSQRRRDSVDRRKVFVSITEPGEVAMRWTHLQWRAAFGIVDIDERPRLTRNLATLTESVFEWATALGLSLAPASTDRDGGAWPEHASNAAQPGLREVPAADDARVRVVECDQYLSTATRKAKCA